jgi:hypothetical protein
MCGGKVIGVFPSSVILEGMGINFTVFSYMDRVDFGVAVDPDLVPDVWIVTEGIKEALADLMEASGLGKPTPVAVPLADEDAGRGQAATPEPGRGKAAQRP